MLEVDVPRDSVLEVGLDQVKRDGNRRRLSKLKVDRTKLIKLEVNRPRCWPITL